MADVNTKRIEEAATTTLKRALLKCPIIDSYIDSNDKTPTWDGAVFVYQNAKQKKSDFLGKAPVQVKGTIKRIVSNVATFSCSMSDLKNYYLDGGCVFFLVSVDTSFETGNIYYSSLHVFDLKKILDKAKGQGSYTIKLDKFPTGKPDEIAAIFMSFVENSRKQIGFIGKDIPSLEQLEKKGVIIDSLTFCAPGLGLNQNNIGSFISSHDFYLYAKPQGLDVEIPIHKVTNAIVYETINGSVAVKEKIIYPSYIKKYEGEKKIIQIGKSISLVAEKLESQDEEKPKIKINISINLAGTLDDYIRDTEFFVLVSEEKELTLNGITIPLFGSSQMDLSKHKKLLRYYKDIKRMLDILGVTEALDCKCVSESDEITLKNLVRTVLYNKKAVFQGVNEPYFYANLKIANLSIWIWATKEDDGYRIENFFNPQVLVAVSEDGTDTVDASQLLLLNSEAFTHLSNMDYDVVEKSIDSLSHHVLLAESVVALLLNVLRGYDEQQEKEQRLLELADRLCDWLDQTDGSIDNRSLRLNRLQIIKRKRPFVPSETIEICNMTHKSNPPEIRCAAFLLLGDLEEAHNSFVELPLEVQEEFLSFPICAFGKPV